MVSKISILIFKIFLLSLQLSPTKSETWIRAGYFLAEEDELPAPDINYSLFTHLICCCAHLNSTNYQLYPEEYISTLTKTVKQKNPLVTTLLSIGGPDADDSIFSSMVSNSSNRKSFINSSIATARRYGFEGLDFYWLNPQTTSNMFNLGILFKEWRVAISVEARIFGKSKFILTAMVPNSPWSYSQNHNAIGSMQKFLDWIHVATADYYYPSEKNFTTAPAPLYDPHTLTITIDSVIRDWIDAGLPENKTVICLPYYGNVYTLVSKDNGIHAPAIIADSGFMRYKEIKNYIEKYSANVTYNSSYVASYCTNGTTWIGFDDVEAIHTKVSYAKEKRLLGYFVWRVDYDDSNWTLSKAAAQVETSKGEQNNSAAQGGQNNSTPPEETKGGQNKRSYPFFVIILPIIAAVIIFLGLVIYFRCIRNLKSKGSTVDSTSGVFNDNAPTLTLYKLTDIEVATDGFSLENKLGEGGYGPVYKGVLLDGKEIAVKKLSKTSTQGFEEFKNEVMLTAKLQHVNLVRLLGFCINKKEQILIYEYMENKSLDYYIFDPNKRNMLDWRKRIHIIEGICQGLLYLQEYSRLTIIHRDLKASNILLDENMNPKISDFGMARIFTNDIKANTERIAGTIGYAPPEYLRRGIYSTKSDVYSFGVLLLQIISGKRISVLYGENENWSILEYAYELWKDGKGMEFMDSSLDDTDHSYKMIRCMHIALLCVQEISIDRPSISEVSWMLKSEAPILMVPKKPAFSKQTDMNVQYESATPNLEICSVNATIVSDVDVR